VKEASYDALVVPGGRAPEYIRLNPRVIEIVRHFAGANKPIAAIATARKLLAAAGVLETGPAPPIPRAARRDPRRRALRGHPGGPGVVDGNLVTAPAWPAHPQWLAAFLKVLGTKIQHGD